LEAGSALKRSSCARRRSRSRVRRPGENAREHEQREAGGAVRGDLERERHDEHEQRLEAEDDPQRVEGERAFPAPGAHLRVALVLLADLPELAPQEVHTEPEAPGAGEGEEEPATALVPVAGDEGDHRHHHERRAPGRVDDRDVLDPQAHRPEGEHQEADGRGGEGQDVAGAGEGERGHNPLLRARADGGASADPGPT